MKNLGQAVDIVAPDPSVHDQNLKLSWSFEKAIYQLQNDTSYHLLMSSGAPVRLPKHNPTRTIEPQIGQLQDQQQRILILRIIFKKYEVMMILLKLVMISCHLAYSAY